MSLSVCDDGHDEVCYTDRLCPVCEALKLASRYEDERDNHKRGEEILRGDLDASVAENGELRKEGSALKSQLESYLEP